MGNVKIIGLDDLEKRLKANATLADVKKVVKQNTLELQKAVVRNAGESTFNKGYFTGNLKQDVSANGFKMEDGGLTGNVGTTVDYGPYLEHGTRFMAAEPFVKKPLEDQKKQFLADMKKLTK